MRIRPGAVVLAACCLLAACGGGKKDAPKTGGLAFAEFKAKLEGLKKAGEMPCTACDGAGKVTDADGNETPCPKCSGKGVVGGPLPPPQKDFEAALGKPSKAARKPGDLVWDYWYYPCQEGTARLTVRRIEPRGDTIRVIVREAELQE
ncbi:hypothetical protein HQ576_17030 [bacterium]|nr:hypothetical protein [bacterium]